MIVKEEAHVIRETLTLLMKHFPIGYWVIDDTGSTDGTQEIIRTVFREAGISGELYETPWENFGFNRSKALEHAYNKSDYVLVWDADDSIEGQLILPPRLTADHYTFIFGNTSGFRYFRAQLFNNRKRWKYVGVLHEYPCCLEENVSSEHIPGNYYFVSGKSGSRSRDPQKYQKDAATLEKALITEPDNARYAFYCANSYKDAGDTANAVRWYKKVLQMKGWIEEKYVSSLQIWDLDPKPEHLYFLVDAYKYSPDRVECIYRLIKYYCVANMYPVAIAYYTIIQKSYEDQISSKPGLFVRQSEYDFYMPYYMIIVGERSKRYDICRKMYEIIFQRCFVNVTDWWIHNLFHNLQYCIHDVGNVNAAFVESMLCYVEALRRNNHTLKTEHYEIMDKVIAANRSALTPYTKMPESQMESQRESQSQSQIRVMLTITTCKRRPLFEETMNSIFRTWKDIQAVDYFFCVDDNSSPEDRALMQDKYPFFDYYMKTPQERGHRESMNIIWNKLHEIQPTYWIHLEDDWLYFKQESYITKGIALLEKYESQNIHQLVFNREYGLCLQHMCFVGGKSLEPGVWLHTRTPVKGRNCAYWPHYSIQPSIIRTKIILELGNYDSKNTFFERDYAEKYAAKGYQTMFFDGIYALHIGKQHWEKDGQNAYSLNGTTQFARNKIPKPIAKPNQPNQPLKGTMSDHLSQILQKITAGTPFGLIRPSDGEHSILSNKPVKCCDKWTFIPEMNRTLHTQLMNAIQTVDPNLYIGIPCNTCNLPWNCTQTIYDDYTVRWNVPANQQTYANIFGNANWQRWAEYIQSYDKGIYVVTSGTNPTSSLKIKGRHVIDALLVDRWDTEASAETDRLLSFVDNKHGEVICFSAGPLSKIWIPQCMKRNPSNIYLDVGASIDIFTKGTTNRMYTSPEAKCAKSICRVRRKNLVYFTVFFNRDYFRLAAMLLASMRQFSSGKGYDVLILTSAEFKDEVKALEQIHPLQVQYLPLTTIFQAACARLRIFDYIEGYEKVLYLDTDIIIKKDLAHLFEILPSENVLYGLESGTIESLSFGAQFFDFTTIRRETTGFNSGTLFFRNSPEIRDLFARIRAHVDGFQGNPPYCMDQPFINYHAIKDGLYNNEFLKPHVSLYEDMEIPTNQETSAVCHFSYPIGNSVHKFKRMSVYFRDLLTDADTGTNEGNGGNEGIVGKLYIWDNNGWIQFGADGILDTKWGKGTYTILGKKIRAEWNNYHHILSLDDDTSIRIQPLDFAISILQEAKDS